MPAIDRDDIAAHGLVLAAGQELSVQTVQWWPSVELVVHSSAAPIYWTTDGSEPTEGGANCRAIPAGLVGVDEVRLGRPYGWNAGRHQGHRFRLLSAAPATVSIQRGE